MNEPILKLHWERFQAHVDLNIATANELLRPFIQDKIKQLVLLSEGCANTNYKVIFENNLSPVVIRIYMREKSALKREIAIHQLVKDKIPVPAYLYADDECEIYPYPYAIVEWIDGNLMREIILSKNESAIRECMLDAGKYLNVLREIKFAETGFFVELPSDNSSATLLNPTYPKKVVTENLRIQPLSKDEEYLPFMLNLLQDKIVKESLDVNLQRAVFKLITSNSHLIPKNDETNLTHADYDPANIMVKSNNGKWQIAAILDWEFAFAGSYLLDIGMMLRYSHKLPSYYEESFIVGITAAGKSLPAHWKKQAKLMDLLCLLQLAHSNPFSERPKMNRDVVSLIADLVNNWPVT